jgi:hypothetical protein
MTDVTGKVRGCDADLGIVDTLLIIFDIIFNDRKITNEISSLSLYFLIIFGCQRHIQPPYFIVEAVRSYIMDNVYLDKDSISWPCSTEFGI